MFARRILLVFAGPVALLAGGAAGAQPSATRQPRPEVAAPQPPAPAASTVRRNLSDTSVRPIDPEATGAAVAQLRRQIVEMRGDVDGFRKEIRDLRSELKKLVDRHHGKNH